MTSAIQETPLPLYTLHSEHVTWTACCNSKLGSLQSASQGSALDILRSPGAPDWDEYNSNDLALSVGRNNLVLPELSDLRRKCADEKICLSDCAQSDH